MPTDQPVDVGGVTIAVQTWPAQESSGRPPVVLLPTTAETAEDWAVVASALCSSRTVYAVNLRGHGPSGLLVTVDGQSLFAVNRALYERGEVLAAQVHSHPKDAYHSSTDDCFSLVTLTGALSVVVPRFGADGLNGCRGWAWYRLTGQGQWALLGPHDQVQIVHEDVT